MGIHSENRMSGNVGAALQRQALYRRSQNWTLQRKEKNGVWKLNKSNFCRIRWQEL